MSRTARRSAVHFGVAALLGLALVASAAGCSGAATNGPAGPATPDPAAVGGYSGSFRVPLAFEDEARVPLVMNVTADGVIAGSWDATTTADLDAGPRPWRTNGAFEGTFVTAEEFEASGTATEIPILSWDGDGTMNASFAVSGRVSDDGLLIGTLFFGDETVLFQGVRSSEATP